ncbi:hypothetical protein BS17DRAFT_770151 [Gyrodon lividus]|nr:hypothetical protein BS17DRAFT_770151 [Gyrodon lividus]
MPLHPKIPLDPLFFHTLTPTLAPFYPHYPPSVHTYSTPPHPGSLYPFPTQFVSFGHDTSTPSPFPGHPPATPVLSQADIDPSLRSSATTNSPDTHGTAQTCRQKITKHAGDQNALPAKKQKTKTSPVDPSTTVPELQAATTYGVGLSHPMHQTFGWRTFYVEEGWKTRIYALAMILNPAMKFEWMSTHWLPEDAKKAHNWILWTIRWKPTSEWLDFAVKLLVEDQDMTRSPPVLLPGPLRKSTKYMRAWKIKQQQSVSYGGMKRTASRPMAHPNVTVIWYTFGRLPWTCFLHRHLLFHNNLTPQLLEALQILKFKYKQEGLSFTSDLIAKPQDYSISRELSECAALELIAAGNLEELNDLFNNSSSSDTL